MAELSLDLIGISEGTDKHSLEHDYLRHYERMFVPFRDAEIDLIEIGVARGASLRTWRRFFNRARIVGIDIDPECRRHADADRNIIVETGSQDDPSFLLDVCRRYCPTIIIDDGSHQAAHIEFAFERLFPALAPGGCYVIEDIAFHYGAAADRHSADAPIPLPEYLGRLTDQLLSTASIHDLRGSRRHAARWIDRLETFGRAVGIWKRTKLNLTEPETAAIERALDAAGPLASWHGFCNRLLEAGLFDRAEQVARRCLDKDDGQQPWAGRALGEVLERRGDLNGALRAVQQSLRAATNADEIELMRGREAALQKRVAT
jgi:hypothetical protein